MEVRPFLTLPEDVLLLIMRSVDTLDLVSLCLTSKLFHALVETIGWKDHVRLHPRSFTSLSKAAATWNAKTQIRYNTLTDRAWQKGDVAARPLSRPWHGKFQPSMAASSSRLIVTAGDTVYSYCFSSSASTLSMEAPGVHLESSFTLPWNNAPDFKRDMTSVAFLPDGGMDDTLLVASSDGTLECVELPSLGSPNGPVSIPEPERSLLYYVPGDPVQSLSATPSLVLSLSKSGCAKLNHISSYTADPIASTLNLGRKSWVAHLSTHSSSPYAAFGTSSRTPLVVHAVTETGLLPTPTSTLFGAKLPNSAVYGICETPPGAPWGASDQIIVSGWFDGVVRVHDLRSSARSDGGDTGAATPLSPVLSLWDPWSHEPVYAVAFGGGACAHAAAGGARHSLVAFWDVRAPPTPGAAGSGARRSHGWSVYAPGSEGSSSPVYGLHIESSRVFGTTQSRPFVLDFGPGVGPGTYDYVPVEEPRGGRWKAAAHAPTVTKYMHSRGVIDQLREPGTKSC